MGGECHPVMFEGWPYPTPVGWREVKKVNCSYFFNYGLFSLCSSEKAKKAQESLNNSNISYCGVDVEGEKYGGILTEYHNRRYVTNFTKYDEMLKKNSMEGSCPSLAAKVQIYNECLGPITCDLKCSPFSESEGKELPRKQKNKKHKRKRYTQ